MKTLTLVVGAGASKELGLPVGAELKSKIARLLDIRFEGGYRQNSGDHQITEALRVAVHHPEGRRGDINEHLKAGWRIRDAMPQAISIDNFIDNHQGDKKIELCGKLAIVKSILDAERSSIIYTDPGDWKKTIDFEATEKCWLNPLMRLITENCRAPDLQNRLASLSFVIFNYDRCIEHYLYSALQNYYKLDAHAAAELLNQTQFFHPYGAVGKLPWQGNGDDAVGFGCALSPHALLANARQIKTFTEGTNPNSSEIADIRDSVATAKNLLFLGFAYHKLNMNLITPTNMPNRSFTPRTFGTARGLSKSDCNEIVDELCKIRSCGRDFLLSSAMT